jgi:hypothetical protein
MTTFKAKRLFAFRPYHELEGMPNIICDGAPVGSSTIITLSHWPGTVLEDKFRADSSTQIAFRWAEDAKAIAELPLVVFVSNNHVDEDGVLSISALVHREWAFEHRHLLEAASICGDFSKVKPEDGDAFKLVWAIRSVLDPVSSPFPSEIFDKSDHMKTTGAQYAAVLPHLPRLVAELDSAALWKEAEAEFQKMRWHIAAGNVTFERIPALDLGFVRVLPAASNAVSKGSPSYPMSHNFAYVPSTIAIFSELAYGKGGEMECYRVAIENQGKWELRYRYESRVQVVSEPLPLKRYDWNSVRDRLEELETATGVSWVADGFDDVVPGIRNVGAATSMPYETVRKEVKGRIAASFSFRLAYTAIYQIVSFFDALPHRKM